MNTIEINKSKKLIRAIKLLIVALLITSNGMAQVAVNTTGNNADASAILDVSSNAKGVLIPRMTASQKGQINNPATGLLIYQTDGTKGFYYNSGSTSTPNWVQLETSLVSEITDADGDTKVQMEKNVDEDKIRFETNGIEKAIIDENGNLGLGTSSPTQKLEVFGIIKLNSSSSNKIIFDGANSMPHTFYDESGNGFSFSDVNTGETMVITHSGNIGIGTTSPSEKLEVNGIIRINSSANDKIIFNSSNSYPNTFIDYNSVGFRFFDAVNGESMVITNNGRLGIGTSSPTERLEVNGSIKVGSYVLPSTDGDNGEVLKTNGNGTLKWSDANLWKENNGAIYRISGRVGIGTDSPAEKLEVKGKIKISSSLNDKIVFGGTQSSPHTFFDNSSKGFRFFDVSNGTSLSISHTGNVGINTHSPNTKLEVSDGAIRINNTIDNKEWDINYDVSSNYFYISENSASKYFKLFNDGALLLTGTGTTPVSGSGKRFMWVPGKSAFRAGEANGTEWDNANIGNYSVAFGYATEASGANSVAMGEDAKVSGNYASAYGRQVEASGNYSTALGGGGNNYVKAQGQYSTAIGEKAIAEHDNATAFGYGYAKGANSLAIGNKVSAYSYCETSVGIFSDDIVPVDANAWHTSDRLFVVGNGSSPSALSNALVIMKDGKTGIGTSTPNTPLDISGNYYLFANYGYLNLNGVTGTAGGNNPYSIKASHNIMASEFNAVSDQRIKTDFSLRNSFSDLQIINQLLVTNYRYIDTVSKGSKMRIGFIAQQVEKIFPQAVNRNSNYIPNIYLISDVVAFDSIANTQTISLSKSYNLKKGDLLKLYDKNQVYERKIIEVISPKVFKIALTSNTANQLFVFGKKVDDFRAVDYDRIFVLGVSATQYLSSEIDTLEQQSNDLEIINQQNNKLLGEVNQQNQNLKDNETEYLERLNRLEQILKAPNSLNNK